MTNVHVKVMLVCNMHGVGNDQFFDGQSIDGWCTDSL